MLRTSILALLTLAGVQAWAQSAAPPAAPDAPRAHVALSVILTASLQVREALVYAGGSFGKQTQTNFSAIAVRHGATSLLFDSGLGSAVASQYAQDMPWWQRPFFKYDKPLVPARAQLDAAGAGPVSLIVLSHAHWDHASGLGDFPGVPVWVGEPERGFIAHAAPGVGAVWPSQVAGVDWHGVAFEPVPFGGYASSFDVFGDASVVLVPMYGHTPGSIGMFVTLDSGKRYFFTGDVSWQRAAIVQARPKFWAARWLVDADPDLTLATVRQLRDAMARDPALVVVPAHDGAAQAELGYFPKWIE